MPSGADTMTGISPSLHPPANGAGPSPASFHHLPLHAGWTKHVGPQGQLYFHNAAQGQSTYQHPSLLHTGPSMYVGPPPAPAKAKAKREKPTKKEPIPDAEGWLRVTTNKDNVFFTHVNSKRSEWTVPDEIRAQVDALNEEGQRMCELQARQEREEKQRDEYQLRLNEAKAAAERRHAATNEQRRMEVARLEQEAKQHKAQEERGRIQQDRIRILEKAAKRRHSDEGEETVKKERLDRESVAAAEYDAEKNEDEEALQGREAAQIAADERDADANSQAAIALPTTASELSSEEGREVFKYMLTSLDGTPCEVNPMMPWDRELPKFVHLRDYTVLASLRDREDVFNEWCRLRLMEKRQRASAGASQQAKASPLTPIEHDVQDSAAAYRQLLEAEVRSTRAKWDDFRREWKRDRRFFAYGRDDREREKSFRSWLRELGEKKRIASERADADFARLLDERLSGVSLLDNCTAVGDAQRAWSTAKRTPGLAQDDRYDAVGSSSRRAELFTEWAKGIRRKSMTIMPTAQRGKTRGGTTKSDSENALRARQEEVRRKQEVFEAQKHRTFARTQYEESRGTFQQLLLDAVHDPLARLENTFVSLARDERFSPPGLDLQEKEGLFFKHIGKLNDRRLRSLEEVFARHAPTLDVGAEHAVPLVRHDDDMVRLRLDQLQTLASGHVTLSDLFEQWQARRAAHAEEAFTHMLRENAFVEFWGRLRREFEQRKSGGGDDDDGKGGGSVGAGGDEDVTDAPSLLQMAAQIDLDEVHAVLQNDQRYRAFQHQPEKRQQWVRTYLQTMKTPKKTVFQKT